MANITQAEITTLATIVAARALGKLKSNTVLARIVNRQYENEIASKGKIVSIPVRGSLSVNTKSANTVVTLQAPSDSAKNVSLDFHREVSFLCEDPARAMASHDVVDGYLQDAIAALAEDIDGSIASLYSGFSQIINATAGLDEEDFRNAQRLLNAAKTPQSDRWAVLSADAYYEASAIERLISRDFAGDGDALKRGYLGTFYGFDIVMDQEVKFSTNWKNLFIQKDAIVMVSRPLPAAPDGLGVSQVVMEEDGVSIRVTMSYSPDYLGLQCTVDALWGVAELRDNHGITVLTAAKS